MSSAEQIAKHLPYLRRYARALTGSQTSGDAYVAAALEALIKDPELLESSSEPRVALFRLFTVIWNSLAVNEGSEPMESRVPAERRLGHLTPRPRQAFLLMSLEGFNEDQTAEILHLDAPKVRALVEEAGRELAAEIATDTLIIEDETFIALDLEGLVTSLGHRVVGIARTHAEAVTLAKAKRPGLILADIQLADGSSGLEAVNELLDTFEVPVIFITAYPERLLTGSRPEPTFLVNKPFRTETVQAVISQALFFDYRAHRPDARVASA